MNIYDDHAELRLDERELSEQLGDQPHADVARPWPGWNRRAWSASCRASGVYIVRKTKAEILEMITVWAALESMAARLITQNASDEEIAALRRCSGPSRAMEIQARIDEYSETNIRSTRTS